MLKKLKHHLRERGLTGTLERFKLCIKENGSIYTFKQIIKQSKLHNKNSKIQHESKHVNKEETNTYIAEINEINSQLNNKTIESNYYLKKLHATKNNLAFNNSIYKSLHNIPVSNGSDFYEKSNINIAIVTDEFTFNSFKDTANLIYINGQNDFSYSELIKKHGKIDFFLYITGWVGMSHKDWEGQVEQNTPKNKKLTEIIKQFRENNVPTVFYSIEDPSDYHTYIHLAKLVDVVFTTAVEKVESYKMDCGHSQCYTLEFAINPVIHNPIGVQKACFEDLLFAGSYMGEKFPERTIYLNKLFTMCNFNNIAYKIIDRNFLGASLWPNVGEMYRFPEEFENSILPEMEYNDLLKTHKLFNWCVNANSIVGSQTMMAMRIYEMQGMGRALVSNYTPSVANKFPNIFIFCDGISFDRIYSRLKGEDLYRHQLIGVRNVLAGNTYFERLDEILSKIKSVKVPNLKVKKLLIIMENNSYLQFVNNQSISNFDFMLAQDKKYDPQNYEYLTFFGKDNKYGFFYLEDMLNCFKYVKSDYVTKLSFWSPQGQFVKNIELDYTQVLGDKEQSIYKTTSVNLSGGEVKLNKESFIGFASDRFNINEQTSILKKTKTAILSVIVPIYNNGDFLRDRLLPSLIVSEHFEKMEIILIDDGSNDNTRTRNIIKEICFRFDNIRSIFLEQPASGSASRPRNIGMQEAKAPHICFIDPDDCINAINFDYVFNEHLKNSNEVTFSSQFMLKHDSTWDTSLLFQNCETDFVVNTNFHPRNITCTFFKEETLLLNNLTFLENAFGEDTLFGYQVLDKVKKLQVLPFISRVYFDDLANSANNFISKAYFEKHAKGFIATLDYFDQTQRSAAFIKHAGFSILKNYLIEPALKNRIDSDINELISKVIIRVANLNLEDEIKNQLEHFQNEISAK